MIFTQEAWEAGKLASLLPSKERRLIVTKGRLGEKSLERILGVTALPILMPESRVAYLYMVYAHSGEFGLVHRSSAILSSLGALGPGPCGGPPKTVRQRYISSISQKWGMKLVHGESSLFSGKIWHFGNF